MPNLPAFGDGNYTPARAHRNAGYDPVHDTLL
jgi:hypothetical protein